MSSLDDNTPETNVAPEHGYWRSLAQLEANIDNLRSDGDAAGAGDHEGAPLEFPATATDETVSDPMSRRSLFQLMGASMALAGVAGTGCKRWEKDEIVPLARRPEDMIPGVPNHYATGWDFAGFGQSLIATSYEGRPIKLDGNPEHPFAGGGTVIGTERHGGSTAFAQASILELYDPDRSKLVVHAGNGANFADFVAWLDGERAQFGSRPPAIRVLSEASSSPTVARLRERLRGKYPGLEWFEWEPVSFDNERAGTRIAFGRSVRPQARLDRAQTIVTLDCDLFVEHPAALRYSRDWGRSRRFGSSTLGEGRMNRTYAIESTFSPTGAVADHRLPLRSELILPFVMALDARLAGGAEPSAEFLHEDNVKRHLDAIVEELRANRSRGVVLAGRRQPKEVHALVARINHAIGAVGATLDYLQDPDPERFDHNESIGRLTQQMKQGQVDYLFILGGNPVYDAPADLDFAGALASVKKASVHLSTYEDETSRKTTWHVPRAHYLESWGDVRTYDGTVTIAQPLIQPMYGGISVIEWQQLMLQEEPNAMAALQATFAELRSPIPWRNAVHEGFVPGTQLLIDTSVAVGQLPPVQLTALQKGGTRLTRDQGVEVVFAPSTQTWDGRFANNPWLQETPDFLTKVTWDNYAMVGPSTAKDLGLKNDTKIKLTIGDRSLEVACYTMPGQAPYSIGVVLGGGRTAAGRTGGLDKKTVGFDAYKLRVSATLDIASAAKVSATGTGYQLANVQEHWDIREGLMTDIAQKGIKQRLFGLVREATLAETQDKGWRAEHEPHYPNVSLFEEKSYEDKAHAWGMTIDLGNCTGCNACAVACQAENNVPVVGKANVIRNREMGWIRIDRYFSGNPDDPQIVHQPLGCVHCENAPCEQVCPVGATLHSAEGLNEMTYNRCIGTRYCLNNCSYRVRRFNFFDYNKQFTEARNKVRQLLFNPEVTVRHRGVMEKCTYCVQRIQNAKINTKNAKVRDQSDGKMIDGKTSPVTACQAACPTEAIVFGDLNDKTSRVARLQATDRRQYELLGELNTKPRTHHLARVRNPNPSLETNVHRGSH